jgi:tRNA nucleotidyltransferase (CCA-adding enzyme)
VRSSPGERALTAERVWQELARALMEATPSRFCRTAPLRALAQLFPEVDACSATRRDGGDAEIDAGFIACALDYVAAAGALAVRYAVLASNLRLPATGRARPGDRVGKRARAAMPPARAPADCCRAGPACGARSSRAPRGRACAGCAA